MMNIKIRNIGLFLLLGFGAISSANAHDNDFFGLSLNLGGPAYYVRPQVYYYARPVYVDPPRVIYYGQPVVSDRYYDAPPDYYDDSYDVKYKHKHKYKHHKHDDDDDD